MRLQLSESIGLNRLTITFVRVDHAAEKGMVELQVHKVGFIVDLFATGKGVTPHFVEGLAEVSVLSYAVRIENPIKTGLHLCEDQLVLGYHVLRLLLDSCLLELFN
jgi:hypothetical protein